MSKPTLFEYHRKLDGTNEFDRLIMERRRNRWSQSTPMR